MTIGWAGGRLARIAILGTVAAWILDRWLSTRSAGQGPSAMRSSVTIGAPIDHAWAVLADIERQPEWMHDLRDVQITTPGPIGVGTRARGRVQAFGISVEDPVEVTAFEAPSHFAIRHVGMVKGGGDIRLTATADRETVVEWEETLIVPLLPYLGEIVLAIIFEPIFARDLERLAALAERG